MPVEQKTDASVTPRFQLFGSQRLLIGDDVTLSDDVKTGFCIFDYTKVESKEGTGNFWVSDDRITLTADGHVVIKSGSVFDYQDEANTDGIVDVVFTFSAYGQETEVKVTFVINESADIPTPIFNLLGSQRLGIYDDVALTADKYIGYRIVDQTLIRDRDGTDSYTVSDDRVTLDEKGFVFVRDGAVFDHETEADADGKLEVVFTFNAYGQKTDVTVNLEITDHSENPEPIFKAFGRQRLEIYDDVGLTADKSTGFYIFDQTVTPTREGTGNFSVSDDRVTLNAYGQVVIKEGAVFDYEKDADENGNFKVVFTFDAYDEKINVDLLLGLTEWDDNSLSAFHVAGSQRVTIEDDETLSRDKDTGISIRDIYGEPINIDTDGVRISDDRVTLNEYGRVVLKSRSVFDYETDANADGQLEVTFFITRADISEAITVKLDITDIREPIEGTRFADRLVGTELDDIIHGYGGDDEIYGLEDDDNIYGNSGDDTIYGGDGEDEIYGGTGSDTIYGGAGDDEIYGHEELGEWRNYFGDDTIFGGAGDDYIEAGRGNNYIDGGEGEDRIKIALRYAGESLLDMRSEEKWKQNADGSWEKGVGEGYEHRRFWRDINENGIEDDGDEYDFATNVEKFFFDIVLRNGLTIYGSEKNDVFVSNYSIKTKLFGLGGDDYFQIRTGNYNLEDGENTFTVDGGAGNDQILIQNETSNVTMIARGGDGDDRLTSLFTEGTVVFDGGAGNDLIFSHSIPDAVRAILISDYRGRANDMDLTLDASSTEKFFEGGERHAKGYYQRFYVDLNNNGIEDEGDEYDLFLNYKGVFDFHFRTGSGDDTLTGAAGQDEFRSGGGRDVLNGMGGDDILRGNGGADTLNGGAGDDKLNGGNGGDTLSGGDGNDRLLGRKGADTLNGGAGDDVLKGGLGRDTFIFDLTDAAGTDRILDFARNRDTIILREHTGDVFWQQVGGNVHLSLAEAGDAFLILRHHDSVFESDFSDSQINLIEVI